MAPLLAQSLPTTISHLETLEKGYKDLLTKKTHLMKHTYDSLMRKYEEQSIHYAKKYIIPDVVENAPELRMSGNDILSMTARKDATLNKDDESVTSYIGNVATQVLTNEVGAEDAKKVNLSDQYTVHLQTNLNFSTGGLSGMSQPKAEEKEYSLLAIALGEPYRKEETNMPSNKRVSKLVAHNTDTPESVQKALSSGKVRDNVDKRFTDDLVALNNNVEAKEKYGKYANQQASLLVLSHLENTDDPDKKNIASLVAQGFLPPQTLQFKGKVLAGMIAYGTEDQLLLVNYEARTSFLYQKNHPNDGFWEFISPTLSLFDKNATPEVDKAGPRTFSRKIGIIEMVDYPENTNIELGKTTTLESDLWSAKIAQLKSNFDGYVYTTEEQSTDKWIEISKSMLQFAELASLMLILGLAAVPQTLLGILIGVGFGVTSEYAERAQMTNTDEGEIFLTSQQAIDTGRILMALGVIPEIGLGRQVLMKTGANSVEQLSKTFKHAIKAAKGKLSVLKMTPQQKSVLAARNGVGDAAFRQKVFPIETNPEKAVINLQKETGEITSEMAASQGVTPGTFLRDPTKELTNPIDLINLPAGRRIILRHFNSTIIFSGLSLGGGKIAGINNTLINSQLNNQWVVINLADNNVLTGSRMGWTLKTSQTRIKIVAEVEPQHILPNSLDPAKATDTVSNTPAKTIKSVGQPQPNETPVLRNSVNVTDINLLFSPPFENLLKKLNTDSFIKAAMVSPPLQMSSTLLENLKHRLLRLDIGMEKVDYRLVYFWNEHSQQSMNHLVLKVEREGQSYFLDLFAKRLGNLSIADIHEPLILTPTHWLQTYMTRTHEAVIIYKDFSSSRIASLSFNYPNKHPAQGHTVIDGVRLTTPLWYSKVISPDYLTNTITHAVNLPPDQAVVLKELVNLFSERSVHSSKITFDMLMTTPQPIHTALQLQSIPKDHLVVLSNRDTHHHVMISLGDGKFATHRLDSVDPSLPMYNGQITSEKLGKKMIDGKIGEFTITSGALNKETLTLDAFLGTGSSIKLEANNVLTITVLNQPEDKSPLSAFLDMSVLEHLWNARGVFYKLDTMETGPVTYLVVSYVAENEEPAVVQALSNHLKKEVSHRNLRNNLTTSYLPKAGD